MFNNCEKRFLSTVISVLASVKFGLITVKTVLSTVISVFSYFENCFSYCAKVTTPNFYDLLEFCSVSLPKLVWTPCRRRRRRPSTIHSLAKKGLEKKIWWLWGALVCSCLWQVSNRESHFQSLYGFSLQKRISWWENA